MNDQKAFPINTLSSVPKISLSGKVSQVEGTHTQIHFSEKGEGYAQCSESFFMNLKHKWERARRLL